MANLIRSIPIRRVANRPALFFGGDRELVMLSMLIAFVLVIVSSNLIAAIIGVIFWLIALYLLRKMAIVDPLLRHVAMRSILRYSRFYSAQSTAFRTNSTKQGNRYK